MYRFQHWRRSWDLLYWKHKEERRYVVGKYYLATLLRCSQRLREKPKKRSDLIIQIEKSIPFTFSLVGKRKHGWRITNYSCCHLSHWWLMSSSFSLGTFRSWKLPPRRLSALGLQRVAVLEPSTLNRFPETTKTLATLDPTFWSIYQSLKCSWWWLFKVLYRLNLCCVGCGSNDSSGASRAGAGEK